MYSKKLRLEMVQAMETGITKDERYELIALVAQRINEFKTSPDLEENQIWDSNDLEIDFDNIVNHYN